MKDAWGRTIEYVRLSLTDACNFCCPYCRPAEITPQSQTQLLSVDEWMNILGAFHHIGVKAVDRKSTRLNSSHTAASRMPSSA